MIKIDTAVKSELLNVFDAAFARAQTDEPVMGWDEHVPDKWYYRLRIPSSYADITPYQRYHRDSKRIADIFILTDAEKVEVERLTGINSSYISGFFSPAGSHILPHLDGATKRSSRCTLVHLTGTGSVFALHDSDGHAILTLPDVVDTYTFYPSKVIHSYKVGNEDAKFFNIWH